LIASKGIEVNSNITGTGHVALVAELNDIAGSSVVTGSTIELGAENRIGPTVAFNIVGTSAIGWQGDFSTDMNIGYAGTVTYQIGTTVLQFIPGAIPGRTPTTTTTVTPAINQEANRAMASSTSSTSSILSGPKGGSFIEISTVTDSQGNEIACSTSRDLYGSVLSQSCTTDGQ
jgi:hypothetical protein